MNRPSRLLLPLVVALALLAGCGAPVAWLVAQFAPPQKVEALYEPPRNKKILVFADDMFNPIGYEPVKRDLTERINTLLVEKKIAAETVDYDRLLDLISATPKFNQLAVSEVGQKLGAEIVLYIEIDKFSLKDDQASPLWDGRFDATVRVVDVQQGRLWPTDRPGGYPMESVETRSEDNPSATYGTELARKLSHIMADKIVKLFHDHRVSAQSVWTEKN